MSGALRTIRALPVCLVLLTFSCARKESLAGTPEKPMGSSPSAAPYVSRASEIRVAYRPISIPDSLKPASEAAVQFEARNTGTGTWPSKGPLVLRFGYHWADPKGTGSWNSIVWDDGHRGEIISDVPRDGKATIHLSVRALDRSCAGCKLIIAPLLQGSTGVDWSTDTPSAYVATVDVR